MASTMIEGVKYEARPMDPLLVLEDTGRLTTMLLASSASLENAALDSGAFKLVLAKLAVGLFSQLKNPEAILVIEHVFSYATANGVELGGQGWRTHFTGKGGQLAQVISWLLKEQFSSFFGGVRSKLGSLISSLGALTGSSKTPSVQTAPPAAA